MFKHFLALRRIFTFLAKFSEFKAVLICYLYTNFHGGEKPKGGPLEIEIFFIDGG